MQKTKYEESIDRRIKALSEEYKLPLDPDIAYKYSRLSEVGHAKGISITTALKSLQRLASEK